MNKTAIKKFAVWAREKLIRDISYKARLLGVSDKGIVQELPQSTADLKFFDIGTKEYTEVSGKQIRQREALVCAIKAKERDTRSYKEAYEYIVEEVAYTWFNRLIALRFMEVNDYLPSGLRVLSSENKGKNEPDLVTDPLEADLDLTPDEEEQVLELKRENRSDELFRMLFIRQCNKLHEILPRLFEKTDDYTELLLTLSFTDKDGIVYKLVHDIEEDDFNIEKQGQIEIIGWLYQYYISKKHDEIINIYKGTIKKQDIPAATQIFTTDWVVRYMVDNSLGRYWMERNPKSKLGEKLQFFVTPKDGHIHYVDEKVSPTDLTFFDPCMGSGHILVYAFDVLMEIYRECGYSDRDASLSIVQHNLYGMDIDRRAYQLAYFAVMMKARSYNRRALTQGVINNLSVVEESNLITQFACEGVTTDKEQTKVGEYLVRVYRDAGEIGTLQTVEKHDYKGFEEYLLNAQNNVGQVDMLFSDWIVKVQPLMLQLAKQAAIMSKKFTVVCTNPPYMNKLEGQLKKFVVDNYKAYSGDLFSVFMYRNFDYCKPDGYSAFMTPFVWMFIKTYEKLRTFIVKNKSITSLIQMEYSAFEEATVPVCSFVLQNCKSTEKALCFRLSDFKGGMEVQKQKVLEALEHKECGYFYEANQSNFEKIPGSPIAYWVSNGFVEGFSEKYRIGKIGKAKVGIGTGNTELFLKIWFEIDVNSISFGEKNSNISCLKWVPINKGGSFRKWYGNHEYVINWKDNGYSVKNYKDDGGKKMSYPRNLDYQLKKSLTWGDITSGDFSMRYSEGGFFFSDVGNSLFLIDEEYMYYILGNCNSKQFNKFNKMINSTIHFKPGNMENMPAIIIEDKKDGVEVIVKENINLSQNDWDSYETSWDFQKHPLVPTSYEWEEQQGSQFAGTRVAKFSQLRWQYNRWKELCEQRFDTLKSNEEELNRIFIDIYGLQDELIPDVADKDITVHRIFDTKDEVSESMRGSKYIRMKRDEMVSLISYAVGCMFGRYSLDEEGLVYAGGRWDSSKYRTFTPEADNCIPLTDETYFEEDIVSRFEEFIRVVYGEDSLEENLDFIANALGNKGSTSREILRNYFLKDFIKDHTKTYQKRPIYWLFESGDENGFKALVYMHRWNADTVGHMRVEYLHRIQRVYEKEIERMQEVVDNSSDKKEVNAATKRKEKLQKQLKETKDYDALIAHLALSRIDIDLDDGVKVNHEKVQTSNDGRFMEVLAKI